MLPKMSPNMCYIADCVSTSSDTWGSDTLPGNAFICYNFLKKNFKGKKLKKLAPLIDM